MASGEVGFEDGSGPPNILLEAITLFESPTEAVEQVRQAGGHVGCFGQSDAAVRRIKLDDVDEAFAFEMRLDGDKYSVVIFQRGPMVFYITSTIDSRQLQRVANAAARQAAGASG